MKYNTFCVVLAALVLLSGCAEAPDPADLVLTGGRIVTMDADGTEVEALAARDGRLVALGSAGEVAAFIGGNTEVIDLDGALAVPGLIEGHGHFTSLGRSRMILDLTRVEDFAEIVEMVAGAVEEAEPGAWIEGRGWHQEKWTAVPEPNVSGLPYHDTLSKVSPDNPVVLTHASGHAVLVNAAALELGGIDDATPDPPGGEIVRDERGRAVGVLRETAENLVTAHREGDGDEATTRTMIELATQECLKHGITSFQDAGSSFELVGLLNRMADSHELGVRLWVMLSEDNENLAAGLPGFQVYRAGDAHLTVGGIKRWVDGALGSHGAWLLEPYTDLPTSTGLNIVTEEELRESARLALEHDLQLCSHAIGDRANRLTLDVYQEAYETVTGPRDLRWRIEHAQHLHPDDIPRFGELGVVAAIQPTHCTSDGPWVPERLGEERSRTGSYVWRDLLETGAVLASGTDVPVEPVDTMPSFYSAVTRRTGDGTAFHPEQVMTRMEALRARTLDAAWAVFEDDIKGSLEVDKLADVTVLSKDILQVPDDEIPDTRVLYTIVGGEVRYRAGSQ
ncbi:MAG: amidohydrolase [Thermoanaerobaculales bacterium]|jgi:predicted amidohydrolase YtcJ|nr:amidohydrolase [Thermoanaerobaculales bacterium]